MPIALIGAHYDRFGWTRYVDATEVALDPRHATPPHEYVQPSVDDVLDSSRRLDVYETSSGRSTLLVQYRIPLLLIQYSYLLHTTSALRHNNHVNLVSRAGGAEQTAIARLV
jgi:hypothetical protein